MPWSKNHVPRYRLHRESGQAIVTLGARDFYLGKHGTDESRNEYDRLIGEWLANGRAIPVRAQSEDGISVAELVVAYYRHAESYHRKNGKLTDEVNKIRCTMRPVARLYGRTPANDFGPLALKVVRDEMVRAGHGRKYTNDQAGRVKRMFRWGVENELVHPSRYQALQAVTGLRRGRTEASEGSRVRPGPDEHVDAVKEHVAPQIWAMIELQRLTGMRSGEVTIMRGCEIDMTEDVWIYRPSSHKTEHYDHVRIVELGPKAQDVIRPFLKAEVEAYLFDPRDAEAARNEERRQNRKSPMTPSQAKRTPKRSPKRPPREFYDRDSYRRAIRRACDKANVPRWHPHQLRHNFATRVRKDHGIEAARILLGHRSPMMTEIYAETDRSTAAQIAAKIG